MRLQFLGAAGQVTGSCYFLDTGSVRLLVDCGMHQERAFLSRNWEPFAVPPESIDYLLLTHAHLDHVGLIPKLVRAGFHGEILTTHASRDLAEIILEDSAEIQEEDAAFKKKRHRREGRKGRFPEQPLYRREHVRDTMSLFRPIRYGESRALGKDAAVVYHDAGHILGSAMLELTINHNGASKTLIFSGDIGQRNRPIVHDPAVFEQADYVVMESTYGRGDHENHGPVEDQLADVINRTEAAGGNLVIPTFAVERAQELMYHIGELIRADRIPHLFVFLDSPMAVDVTEVFRRHTDLMDDETQEILDSGKRPFRYRQLKLVRSRDDSKAINRIRGSCIIMAGSGMCTSGRIKHHLVRNISRPESTVLFVGYQAKGTLGREILSGEREVRILGRKQVVKAGIEVINGLSAHAGRRGLLDWIGNLRETPKRLFLTHGEPDAAEALAHYIKEEFQWSAEIPAYKESFDL